MAEQFRDAAPAVSRAALLDRGRRYTLVGALCALAHNAIMIGGDAAGLHYFPATILSFLLVTPLGFALHCRFTFREPTSVDRFLRFASGIAAGYPLSLALMALFCSGLGLKVIIAAPLATLLLFVFNYLSAHWAIVRRLHWR